MCGILGIILPESTRLPFHVVASTADSLFTLSESRGKESAGVAVGNSEFFEILKGARPPSRLIKTKAYKDLLKRAYRGATGHFVLLGHSRLATDGIHHNNKNNQPISGHGLTCIHNGIVVNADELFGTFRDIERQCEVDTEIIVSLVHQFRKTPDRLSEAVQSAYAYLKGTASIALMQEKGETLCLATNTGSVYIYIDKLRQVCFFASERFFIEKMLRKKDLSPYTEGGRIWQIKAGKGCAIDTGTLNIIDFDLPVPRSPGCKKPPKTKTPNRRPSPAGSVTGSYFALPDLKRCSKCVLPETIPFIHFDDRGVCNFCNSHKPHEPLGIAALEELVQPYRRNSDRPDCLIGLSGGRDSCYGLHYIKTELGLNPVAFTYDWGMVTDLARRNQARLCGKLGVEHIIVSADIDRKRHYINANIKAWMKKPEPGMIPLFMAGDKQFFYYGRKLKKTTDTNLLFWCNNHFEKCEFKSGFAGIRPQKERLWEIPLLSKLKISSYYLKQYLTNTLYFNRSFADTLFSFVYSWIVPQKLTLLYDYIKWDKDEMMKVLSDEYEWETDEGTKATWRIGDGTAAFYNYIYFKIAGFTEHDAFRSNQIREGILDRQEAMALLEEENKPNYTGMQWYADKIGFDLEKMIRFIDSLPAIY